MGRGRNLSKCFAILLILATINAVVGVESDDYYESLRDDDEVRKTDVKESVTEYPNGVNVIPGEAEIHYPIYAKIPKSAFSCLGRPTGFYADTDLRCQVWHICDETGAQQSFLCTNGTIYSQDKRVCDWWYNVNCDPEEVNRNYEQNRDLYKGPPSKSQDVVSYEEDNSNDIPLQRKQSTQPQPQNRPNYEQQKQQQQNRRPSEERPVERRPTENRYTEPEEFQQRQQSRDRNSGNQQSNNRQQQQQSQQQQHHQQQQPQQQPRNVGSTARPSNSNGQQSGGAAVPEKKRVIVLRLPGPLPPGATIPPHVLREYAESVLAAERAGKVPPTGLPPRSQSRQYQETPRPTTQAPPPPPPPPQQRPQPAPLKPIVSAPFKPVVPYTPRPFSQFLAAASKYNGQTRPVATNSEPILHTAAPQQIQNSRPAESRPTTPAPSRQSYEETRRPSPPPQRQEEPRRPSPSQEHQQSHQQGQNRQQEQQQRQPQSQNRQPENQYRQPENENRRQESQNKPSQNQHRQPENQHRQPENQHRQPENQHRQPANQQRQPETQRPHQNQNRQPENQHNQQAEPQNRNKQPVNQYRQPESSQRQPETPNRNRQAESQYKQSEERSQNRQSEEEYNSKPKSAPQTALPEKKAQTKAPKAPPSDPHKKFRHSTPRKHTNVKFAPKGQFSSDDFEEERQFPEESRRPAYPFQFNNFHSVPHHISAEESPKAELHLKSPSTVQDKPRRRPQETLKESFAQEYQPTSPAPRTTETPIEDPIVHRLVVVARQGLKIKDPSRQEATTQRVRVQESPRPTTQAPPPPPPPQKQQKQQQEQRAQPVPLAPIVSAPFKPVVPYTPRPFSQFLEAASKYNGQTRPVVTSSEPIQAPAPTPQKQIEQARLDDSRPPPQEFRRQRYESSKVQTTPSPTKVTTSDFQTSSEGTSRRSEIVPTVSSSEETSRQPGSRRVIKVKKLRHSTTSTTTTTEKTNQEEDFDIYGRNADEDEEEELIRAVQLYQEASEHYGKRRRPSK